MKTMTKVLTVMTFVLAAGFAATAQEAQEDGTPRETSQTEKEDQQVSPTAEEYEAEEETSEDELPAEKALQTETEGTYDAETENVPTMETETYRSEAEDEGLIEEEDTVGAGAMQMQDFSAYDADNDGRIDEEEFKASYTHNSSARDTNQDGILDEGEFKAAQGTIGEDAEVAATDQEGVTDQQEVADQYEKDSEVAAKKPGESEEFVTSIFEAIDEDSDGYIDETEFTTWTGTKGKK